jgi:hypothetical protein
MDLKDAREVATSMLVALVKNQPNLIQFATSSKRGNDAAAFCTDFIDSYADWLVRNNQPKTNR